MRAIQTVSLWPPPARLRGAALPQYANDPCYEHDRVASSRKLVNWLAGMRICRDCSGGHLLHFARRYRIDQFVHRPARGQFRPIIPIPFPSNKSLENIAIVFRIVFFRKKRRNFFRERSVLEICISNICRNLIPSDRASKDKNNSKKWFPSAYHNVTDTRARGKEIFRVAKKSTIEIAYFIRAIS